MFVISKLCRITAFKSNAREPRGTRTREENTRGGNQDKGKHASMSSGLVFYGMRLGPILKVCIRTHIFDVHHSRNTPSDILYSALHQRLALLRPSTRGCRLCSPIWAVHFCHLSFEHHLYVNDT